MLCSVNFMRKIKYSNLSDQFTIKEQIIQGLLLFFIVYKPFYSLSWRNHKYIWNISRDTLIHSREQDSQEISKDTGIELPGQSCGLAYGSEKALPSRIADSGGTQRMIHHPVSPLQRRYKIWRIVKRDKWGVFGKLEPRGKKRGSLSSFSFPLHSWTRVLHSSVA